MPKNKFPNMNRVFANKPSVVTKFTEDEQIQICRWIAEFYTTREIQKKIKEQFGKECTDINIDNNYRYSNKWHAAIDKLRTAWAAGMMRLPLAHKRGRMEMLAHLITKAEKDPNLKECEKRNEIRQTLNQMRLEMDETKSNFTAMVINNFSTSDDKELIKRRDELIEKLKAYKMRPLIHETMVDVEPIEEIKENVQNG